MKKYYVSTISQTNSDCEVHSEDCIHLQDSIKHNYLGLFFSYVTAVEEAKKQYINAKRCWFCSRECHIG